jgi:hypothetical protein
MVLKKSIFFWTMYWKFRTYQQAAEQIPWCYMWHGFTDMNDRLTGILLTNMIRCKLQLNSILGQLVRAGHNPCIVSSEEHVSDYHASESYTGMLNSEYVSAVFQRWQQIRTWGGSDAREMNRRTARSHGRSSESSGPSPWRAAWSSGPVLRGSLSPWGHSPVS